MGITHGSIFSGIGGFDLAASWMGWRNEFSCEIDEFCRQVLADHFPNVPRFEDVTKQNFEEYAGRITVLSGGFPCQDASVAKQWGEGKKGVDGERTGLWRSMVRVIGEVRPKYVVAENVAYLLKTNGGKDFGGILGELAAMGYDAEWRVCHASEVGAPHHRPRLYLVAYPVGDGLPSNESFFAHVHEETQPTAWQSARVPVSIVRGGAWQDEPPILCMDDGVPARIYNRSIHAFGNAIIPQIAHKIFIKIQEHEERMEACRVPA